MVYMGREIIGIEYIGEEREVRQLKILKDKLKFFDDKTYYKVRIGNVNLSYYIV